MCELCCCDIISGGPSCQRDPIQQRTQILGKALMGTLTKNVHIMWGSHSSRSYNTVSPPLCHSQSLSFSLPPSLSATCRVYRTISRASGLFNVVIQAEHNCVPPSDRRLRTSSLLTKKPTTQRWSQAHLREEIFLCPPPPPSFSLFLFSWLGEKKGSKDNGCLITM